MGFSSYAKCRNTANIHEGAFWLTYGATLQPFYSVSGNYAIANNQPASMGSQDPGFMSAFCEWRSPQTIHLLLNEADSCDLVAFLLLWMGFMSLIYLICALRTNIVFVFIFLGLMLTFLFLAAGFWHEAEGDKTLGMRLIIGGGACGFVACLFGWYIFLAILLSSLDFPFTLPGESRLNTILRSVRGFTDGPGY